MELAEELDLSAEVITPAAAVGKRRFIYRNGRLHLVPAGPHLMLSPLLSLRGRLRIMAEPFIKPKKTGDDESVASFICRRLGHEILDALVDPFISGIYAGDPHQLSINTSAEDGVAGARPWRLFVHETH
jgi:oxygen-dependent protoporphyrinogen oxidase